MEISELSKTQARAYIKDIKEGKNTLAIIPLDPLTMSPYPSKEKMERARDFLMRQERDRIAKEATGRELLKEIKKGGVGGTIPLYTPEEQIRKRAELAEEITHEFGEQESRINELAEEQLKSAAKRYENKESLYGMINFIVLDVNPESVEQTIPSKVARMQTFTGYKFFPWKGDFETHTFSGNCKVTNENELSQLFLLSHLIRSGSLIDLSYRGLFYRGFLSNGHVIEKSENLFIFAYTFTFVGVLKDYLE